MALLARRRGDGPSSEGRTFRQKVDSGSVYICASFGGLVAAVADLVQKEDASAVVKMTSASARFMQITAQPIYILLFIIALSGMLCFVFQPEGRKNSFGIGAGVVALIMTITPYKAPLTGIPTDVTVPKSNTLMRSGDRAAEKFERENIKLADLNGVWVPPLSGVNSKTYASLQEPILKIQLKKWSTGPVRVSISVKDSSRESVYSQNTIIDNGTVDILFELNGSKLGSNVQYTIDIEGNRVDIGDFFIKGPITEFIFNVDRGIMQADGIAIGSNNQIVRDRGFAEELRSRVFKKFPW